MCSPFLIQADTMGDNESVFTSEGVILSKRFEKSILKLHKPEEEHK